MTNEDSRLARWYIGAFVLCIVLTLLSVAFVDRAVATWAHTLDRPAPFVWLTYMIDPFVPAASIVLPALGIAALFGWRPGPLGRIVLALCVAVLFATLLKEELKFLFGRTWPETWVANNPSWIRDGVYRFEPLHGGHGWASLPSGHMALIAAPCTRLWVLAPAASRCLSAALVLALAAGLIGVDLHLIGH